MLPTFQISFGKDSNLLDLVLTESCNRIFCVEHLPPLGGIEHGHHVLNFKYSYKKNSKRNSTQLKNKLLYRNGKYDDLSKYFSSFDWDNEFMNLDANVCYIKWMDIYYSGQWRSVMEAKYANEYPKVRKKTQKVSQNF